MEYAPNGTLHALLHSADKRMLLATVTSSQRLQMLYDVAAALQHLHNNDIVHGDVKPLNALLFNGNRVKICDFGLSKTVNTIGMKSSTGTQSGGTQGYMALEVLQCHSITPASDAYSYGMLIYEVITGIKPYANLRFETIHAQLLQGAHPAITADSVYEGCTSMQPLMEKCWQHDAALRPDFDEVIHTIGAVINIQRPPAPGGSAACTPVELPYITVKNRQKELGSGTFSTVYRAVWSSKKVAIKVANTTADCLNKAEANILKELQIHSSNAAKHDSIIALYGACYVPNKVMIMMELAPHGTLRDLLHSPAKPSERLQLTSDQRLQMLYDTAAALQHLHSNSIVHGDLKPANVLLFNGNRVKLSDFRSATVVTSFSAFSSLAGGSTASNNTQRCGTPGYMAPEILMGNATPSYSTDVYSYSIIMYEVITGTLPYEGFSTDVGIRNLLADCARPDVTSSVIKGCEVLTPLMQQCWLEAPTSRPTSGEVASTVSGVIAVKPSVPMPPCPTKTDAAKRQRRELCMDLLQAVKEFQRGTNEKSQLKGITALTKQIFKQNTPTNTAEAVVRIMSDAQYEQDSVVQEWACMAISIQIGEVSKNTFSKQNQIDLGTACACGSVVAALLCHSSNAQLSCFACEALDRLAYTNALNISRLVAEEACNTIVVTIQQHVSSAKLAHWALPAVLYLASTERTQQQLVKAGACAAVIAVMNKHTADRYIAEWSLAVVHQLAAVDSDNVLGTVGACEAAVAALQQHAVARTEPVVQLPTAITRAPKKLSVSSLLGAAAGIMSKRATTLMARKDAALQDAAVAKEHQRVIVAINGCYAMQSLAEHSSNRASLLTAGARAALTAAVDQHGFEPSFAQLVEQTLSMLQRGDDDDTDRYAFSRDGLECAVTTTLHTGALKQYLKLRLHLQGD
eukprot:19120-Heterococcus_DN1.PRE.3